MFFLKKYWILLLILAVAFTLRVVGIFYAYPLLLIGDETPTLLASLRMIGMHSLRAATPGYYYPALLSYAELPFLTVFLIIGRTVGLFESINAMKESVFLNLGLFIPVVRFTSVLLGVATVFLVYKISFRLFSRAAGLVSAWFLAISYYHVSHSHFAQTWVAQVFFIILSLHFAIKFYQQKDLRTRNYILGGLLVGIAFGINLVGILSYYWFVLVHFLKNSEDGLFKIFIKNKNFWLMNLTLLLSVGLIYYANPYGLNNYFNRIIGPRLSGVDVGNSSYEIFDLSFFERLFYYIKNIFIQEPIIFVLAFFGSIFLWFREKISFYFLAPWIAFYCLMLSPLTGEVGRHILPILPLLVIISCRFILQIKKYINSYVWKFLIIAISIYSLFFCVLFDLRMLKNDTRVLARNWILNNIPSGSAIKNEDLGESLCLVENKQSVKLIKENYPELFSTKRKYLLGLPDENYPKPSYLLIVHPNLSKLVPAFNYIILSSFDKEKMDFDASKLSESAKLIKSFYPINNLSQLIDRRSLRLPSDDLSTGPWLLFEKVDVDGPFIEIYKIE